MADLFVGLMELLALVVRAIMAVIVRLLAAIFRLLRLQTESKDDDPESQQRSAKMLAVVVCLISAASGVVGYYVGESWQAAAWGIGIGAFLSVLGAFKSYEL